MDDCYMRVLVALMDREGAVRHIPVDASEREWEPDWLPDFDPLGHEARSALLDIWDCAQELQSTDASTLLNAGTDLLVASEENESYRRAWRAVDHELPEAWPELAEIIIRAMRSSPGQERLAEFGSHSDRAIIVTLGAILGCVAHYQPSLAYESRILLSRWPWALLDKSWHESRKRMHSGK